MSCSSQHPFNKGITGYMHASEAILGPMRERKFIKEKKFTEVCCNLNFLKPQIIKFALKTTNRQQKLRDSQRQKEKKICSEQGLMQNMAFDFLPIVRQRNCKLWICMIKQLIVFLFLLTFTVFQRVYFFYMLPSLHKSYGTCMLYLKGR